MKLEKAVSLWRREHSHHACAWGRRADTEIKEAFENLLQEAGQSMFTGRLMSCSKLPK